jgi:hypothetical protein
MMLEFGGNEMVLFLFIGLLFCWFLLVFGRTGQAQSLLFMPDLGEPSPMSMVSGQRGRVARRYVGMVGEQIDLSKRRRWFADDDGGGGEIDLDSLDPATRSYIDGLRKELDEIKHETIGRRKYIDRIEAEKEALAKNQQKQLEADGKYKELYEAEQQRNAELAMRAQKADSYEELTKARNEARIEQIPEDWRDAVPPLPPAELSVWLDKNASRFTVPSPPELDAGASTGGGKPVTLTPEEEIAYQTGDWESKEQFLEFKKKSGV